MTLNEVSGCYKWGLWFCETGPQEPLKHIWMSITSILAF